MPDIFSPQTTAKAVHDTLDEAYASIPEGKSHVLLVDASRESGVRAIYAQRVAGGWNVALEGEWRGTTHAAGKIGVLKAW